MHIFILGAPNIAQSRPNLCTLGPEVGIVCILGGLEMYLFSRPSYGSHLIVLGVSGAGSVDGLGSGVVLDALGRSMFRRSILTEARPWVSRLLGILLMGKNGCPSADPTEMDPASCLS